MKNLLDIQKDVRQLEQRSEETSQIIKTIYSDINNLRNSQIIQREISDINFDAIELMSSKIKFNKHPIFNLDKKTKTIYLTELLKIVLIDSDLNHTNDRLVFFQWIYNQAKIEYPMKELYVETLRHRKELNISAIDDLTKEFKDLFITDALLIATITGDTKREIYEHIVDIALILGLDKENISMLALITKAILRQDFSDLSKEQIKRIVSKTDLYDFYLLLNKEIINSNERVIEVKKKYNDSINFEWKKSYKSKVVIGDLIAMDTVLNMNTLQRRELVPYFSKHSGYFYWLTYKGVNYGIISSESDNENEIIKWIEKMNGNM